MMERCILQLQVHRRLLRHELRLQQPVRAQLLQRRRQERPRVQPLQPLGN